MASVVWTVDQRREGVMISPKPGCGFVPISRAGFNEHSEGCPIAVRFKSTRWVQGGSASRNGMGVGDRSQSRKTTGGTAGLITCTALVPLVSQTASAKGARQSGGWGSLIGIVALQTVFTVFQAGIRSCFDRFMNK